MEQGTGKTLTLLSDSERLVGTDKIQGLLVIAPNGVSQNWTRREIPEHLEVPHVAVAWRSGAGIREMKAIEKVFAPYDGLHILAMNIDAVNTKKGYAFAEKFLKTFRSMLVVDESGRIKNPKAACTKAVIELRHYAKYARIATGTPVTNAPVDIFSQFQFMKSGLLGTNSYRAFVAEYSELLSLDSPMMKRKVQENPRMAFAQIYARDKDGNPIWRNLDKLQKLIEPHSYRVLKRDCLDLPQKIYQQVFFDLSAKQRKTYDLMKDECRIELTDSGEIMAVSDLGALTKLQQITSNFCYLGSRGMQYVSDDNPRMKSLIEVMEDVQGKVIIWARFKEEIREIVEVLCRAGKKVVQFHGEVSGEDRQFAVDSFQTGDANVFVGQAQSGGIGITLTAAHTCIYFSQDYNLANRLQSEDRCHRIGTTKSVIYIDLVAADTIDEVIVRTLQRKTKMAAHILGD